MDGARGVSLAASCRAACSHGGSPLGLSCALLGVRGMGRVKLLLLLTSLCLDRALELLLWKPGLAPRRSLSVSGQVFSRGFWTTVERG